MPNNTPTYWSARGESLHTYARSIESLGPGLRVPGFRGENIVVPGSPGDVWVPKDVASRSLPLGMWVRGTSDGGAAFAGTSQLFHTNWNNLVRLLWTPGEQFELTKRFYDLDSTLRSATAMAEFMTGLEPTMIGKSAAKSIVELRLANPYFYDDVPQTMNLITGDNIIDVRGNAPTRRIKITINGARKNTIIRRKIPATPDHQVQITTDLSSGDFSTIDVENYSATTKRGSAPTYDSTVDVRHSGSRAWLELKPGLNVLAVSSDSGIGSIQIEYRGAWA